MDETDRNLLQLLKTNSRAPLSELAAKLGVSRGTVRNRIERLTSQRIIERFTVQLAQDTSADEIAAFALIRLHANDGRRTLIALRKIASVTRIHTLSGPFDLVAELKVPNLKQLDQVLDSIREIPDVAETQSHIKLSEVDMR